MGKKELSTIRGIIVPFDWNAIGTVIRVALVTYDEDRFLIANNTIGKKLMFMLREKVTVDGTIKEDGASKVIDIVNYKIDKSTNPEIP